MSAQDLPTLNVSLNLPQSNPKAARFRPTWVEISRRAFSSNLKAIQNVVGPQVQIMAVLKANAYGHGAVPLASLAQSNAALIGVSSIEEALELRAAQIKTPIVILGGVYPFENFNEVCENNFIPTIASFKAAKALAEIANNKKRVIDYHLKVDTGMNRIGVSVEEAQKILAWSDKQRLINAHGVYSHLSSADSDETFTQNQITQFKKLKESSSVKAIFHLANSAGILCFNASHFDMVRPGISLYGHTLVSVPSSVKLTPVLSWYTQISFLKTVPKGTPISYGQTFVAKRESRIATLPVGYADGVPRLLSSNGFVLVTGKRCPIVGRVTMDQIMVDVTDVSSMIGDPVVLIGQQGQERISADEWAQWAQTISYEIFCGISKRVPRVMVD